MNEPKWKPGDVVVLKTGGPEMTVDRQSSELWTTHVRCIWFARHPTGMVAGDAWQWGAQQDGEFHQDALIAPARETANAG